MTFNVQKPIQTMQDIIEMCEFMKAIVVKTPPTHPLHQTVTEFLDLKTPFGKWIQFKPTE